ncbi:MAG TPA: HEAT repeat domain-containing protein [Gemmatimonadaceae bacterium]|jgi:HEAT repeat protein|nr:HEAT repeat domain-containing protein [Gemmatimonadaceae bacterium]
MKITTMSVALTLAATSTLAAAQPSTRATYERSYSRTARATASANATAHATAQLGASDAGPTLPALRQGDPADSLYRRAREALNRRNYNQAADLFKQVTDRFPRSRSAPSAMYFRAFSLYQTESADRMREARDVLTALGRDYPNADLADARALRLQICGKLAQRGDAECAAEVARVADPSRGQASGGNAPASGQPARCADDDDDERIVALNALLQMDSERAMPLLKRVMERRDACAHVLRRKAVWLISQKGGDEAADLLMQAARNDPDREVREQAIFWLGQVRTERAVDLLEDVLKNSTDRDVRDKAIFALSQQRNPRAGQILRDFAERESEPQDLREQAIFWLGQNRSEENANYLKSLYGRVKNDGLKEKIIFSLSQQRAFGNGDWVMNIALDQNESIEMRKHALFWAGQSGASIDQFSSLYDKVTESEIKEQLIFVLSQRGRDAKAIDKLMDIARNDKDREMRSKAIFWLGQSRDPRVAKFLEDLISR